MSAQRDLWWLDPAITFLNHGSFGATPKVVLQQQAIWRQRMETQPVQFLSRELPALLRTAASELASFLHTDSAGLAFVDNATSAVNAVLTSLDLRPGDVVVLGSLAYPAVRNAALHACQRSGATLHTAALPTQLNTVEQLLEPYLQALALQPKLLIVDHVISPTAWVLPVASLIASARQCGVPVLVDGAHAPGMLPLDLAALDADWYTGNLHKWLFAPKGCAFLATRENRRAQTHPLVISNGYGQGYVAEFDWTGTRDPSAWLSIAAALQFHRELGGFAQSTRNHHLAWAGANQIAARCNLTIPAPATAYGSMVALPLPLAGDATTAQQLHEQLLAAHIEVPIFPLQQQLWLRVSAQAYNRAEEYLRLADRLAVLLHNKKPSHTDIVAPHHDI